MYKHRQNVFQLPTVLSTLNVFTYLFNQTPSHQRDVRLLQLHSKFNKLSSHKYFFTYQVNNKNIYVLYFIIQLSSRFYGTKLLQLTCVALYRKFIVT